MLDRYLDRPDATFKSSKSGYLDSFCFAEFLSYYYVHCKSKEEAENDNEPVVLDDELINLQRSATHQNETISLMGSNEKLKRRKVRAVLRYHVPNRHRNPEQYAHHLLFSFYLFRDEGNLKHPIISENHLAKLQQPEELNVVNQNKLVMEPFSDFVAAALANVSQCAKNRHDTFLEQENDETEIEIREPVNSLLVNEEPAEEAVLLEDMSQIQSPRPVLIQDEGLNSKIRSLNDKQRKIFDMVHGWAKKSVKKFPSLTPTAIDPPHIFLTGNAGCGKSFLTKVLYQSLSKTFSYRNSELEKAKVLLLAPTGVAAINIGDTTIHTGLNIPVGCFGKHLPPLSDKMRSMLRNRLSEVKVLIIDEVSMVSNDLLLHIHLRLTEIFASKGNFPFAGITVIAVGDFLQLPPARARPVYPEYKNTWHNLDSLRGLFEIAEFTEVMRH